MYNRQRQLNLPVLSILVTLDAFFLGGLVALLMVNRFLNNHLARYAQGNFRAEGSTILDLMDDLLIYFAGYIGVLLVLLLITAVIWVWSKTQSRTLRYGVVLLVVSIVLVVAIVWVGRFTTATPPPPMTPTPIAMVGEMIKSPAPVPGWQLASPRLGLCGARGR
jgi:type III secretory pathway component EscS